MTSSKSSLSPERRLGALWTAAWQSVPDAITRTLAAGGWALEVGCGSGLACLALAEAIPAARVVGHDENQEAIERARELVRAAGLFGRVTFAIDDSTRLPRASFHLITAQGLCTRHAQPRRVLNAIRNALVPEGTCLVLDPPRTHTASAPDLQTLSREVGFSRFRRIPSEGYLRLYELRR